MAQATGRYEYTASLMRECVHRCLNIYPLALSLLAIFWQLQFGKRFPGGMIPEWQHQSFAESPDPGADNGAVAVQLESKVVENYRKCFDRLFDSIQVGAESRVW